MEWLDFLLNVDEVLASIIQQYGGWTYALLFAVIFAETGLVVTPFLPGDSLLFAAGAFAGAGSLSFVTLCLALSIAAILGDTVNYSAGKYLGRRLTCSPRNRWIKREHLDRTHSFFDRYGPKTIVLARFVPIVRTFAPFVAGMGTMDYGTFLFYNIAGGLLWVVSCVSAGYLFGGLELVKNNFELVILAIIFVSVLPAIIEYIRAHRAMKSASVPPAGHSEKTGPTA